MDVGQELGWFVLGFLLAAVVLYGPVMGRSLLMIIRANAKMAEAIKVWHQSTEQLKVSCKNDEQHLEDLKELNALGKEHLELQGKYENLLNDHIAALKKLDHESHER